jgi:hypothetical protein
MATRLALSLLMFSLISCSSNQVSLEKNSNPEAQRNLAHLAKGIYFRANNISLPSGMTASVMQEDISNSSEFQTKVTELMMEFSDVVRQKDWHSWDTKTKKFLASVQNKPYTFYFEQVLAETMISQKLASADKTQDVTSTAEYYVNILLRNNCKNTLVMATGLTLLENYWTDSQIKSVASSVLMRASSSKATFKTKENSSTIQVAKQIEYSPEKEKKDTGYSITEQQSIAILTRLSQ